MLSRRRFVQGFTLAVVGSGRAGAREADASAALELLRQGRGGLVVAMRHALAPGTFDPPGFRPGVCSTQRNLSDEGREQARRIGAWYRERGLVPTAVRSSEWCRCLDTARLAFGSAAPWPALNSFIRDRDAEAAQTRTLRAELARRSQADVAGFEVWVTHQVNLSALAGSYTGSGEALLLRHEAGRAEPRIVASLTVA